jgi:stage III sporulation protein AA
VAYLNGKAPADEKTVREQIIPYLAPHIRRLVAGLKGEDLARLEEIRLRCGQPVIVNMGDRDMFVDARGSLTVRIEEGCRVEDEDIYRTIAAISDNSLYAFEEEIRRGFITLRGGHRVGLAGQIVMGQNEIKTMKNFASLVFRVARQVINCARPLLPYVIPAGSHQPVNTILISPPNCGKTTMLRDLARILSYGREPAEPMNVAIIDERSELAGCYLGVPQLDVGPRTDVLDGCPKASGMIMALRSLAPRVIITDEIGRTEDIDAVQECLNAGVTVITSAHAGNAAELQKRPLFTEMLKQGAFRTGIVLSRRDGPGSISSIERWN